MAILTVYKNKTKSVNNVKYYYCSFYNIKMKNNYWLNLEQINLMNSKIENLKIKYTEIQTNNDSELQLENLLNQYAQFDDNCQE